MQNQSNVHVKIQCDNEFRRFVLTEVTYDNLAEKIRTLLGIAPEITFKLSYLDDENDWVLFATDNELQYAVLLSKSPMKISVKLCSPSSTTTKLVAWPNTFVPTGTKMAESDESTATNTEMSEEKPWKRCRGGGRGGLRGGRGGCKNPAVAERLDAKIARLTDRHATLTAKLIEDDLPEEKARGIEWRLSHLQNKIDFMKARKQQLNDVNAVPQKDEGHQETSPAPVQETARDEKNNEVVDASSSQQENYEEFPFSGRGRRGGCRGGRGRGSWRREQFSHETTDACEGSDPSERKGCGRAIAFACSTPEGKAAFELLQARKEAVQAARRDKAGKEVILQRIEELKEAKAAWKEIKMALWKEKRAAAASCTREAK
jgi:hypothetical protein